MKVCCYHDIFHLPPFSLVFKYKYFKDQLKITYSALVPNQNVDLRIIWYQQFWNFRKNYKINKIVLLMHCEHFYIHFPSSNCSFLNEKLSFFFSCKEIYSVGFSCSSRGPHIYVHKGNLNWIYQSFKNFRKQDEVERMTGC